MYLTGEKFIIELANDPVKKVWGKGGNIIGKPITTNLDYEARQLQKNGGAKWVKVRGKIILSDRGEPERIIGVVQDLTRKSRTKYGDFWKQFINLSQFSKEFSRIERDE